MAYTKNTWVTGDIVTSAKLNHMEDGIANASGLVVHLNNNGELDKTWQEIADAFPAVYIIDYLNECKSIVTSVLPADEHDPYAVVEYTPAGGVTTTYTTDTNTGYPSTDNPR